MRIEFDEQGYVRCILYGCSTGACIEYTGLVPEEPEKYADIDDWANRALTNAYYLNDAGNLTYDASKAVNEVPVDVTGSYFSVETLTNSRWIDGRPIYRKTIELPEMGKNTEKAVDTGVDGGIVDTIINVDGMIKLADAWGCLSYAHNSDTDYQTRFTIGNLGTAGTNMTCIVKTGASRVTYGGHVTIAYTKTTDA